MPALADFVTRDRVLLELKASSKRQLFQDLAAAVERASGVDQAVALAALVQREKLGTTGIGEGAAVPHARLKGLPGLLGLFARLAKPVDYDSLDDVPVDLVFLLVAPEDENAEQLKALARVARLLRDPALTARLRRETDPDVVHGIITGRVPAAAP
jgi:PTS system nitrogen regulatory IIA component